jgi:hypothetical protein
VTRVALISDRERERAVRQADRERVKSLQWGIKELTRKVARQKIESRKKRRELLSRMRRALRAVPRRDRTTRAEMLLRVAAERDRFKRWWDSVLLERAKRRAVLSEQRRELKSYRATSNRRIAAAVEQLRRLQGEELERFERDQDERLAILRAGLDEARRTIATERRDQRQMSRTKRQVKERAKRVTKRERAKEFSGGVEANLTTALEHAVWKRERGLILSNARARGIKEPDAIAELVRERVEADEERAVEFLADDADAWLAAELQRKGY